MGNSLPLLGIRGKLRTRRRMDKPTGSMPPIIDTARAGHGLRVGDGLLLKSGGKTAALQKCLVVEDTESADP